MEDNILIDAVERFLAGDMLPDEKTYFEHLRKNTPGIDQMVVEHKLYLSQIDSFSNRTNLLQTMNKVHKTLVLKGDIYEGAAITGKRKVIQLWNKYRRVTAIAACIAGVTAFLISGLISLLAASPTQNDIEQLNRKVNNLTKAFNYELKTSDKNSEIKNQRKIVSEIFNSAGSGFMIDAKGYIITNAHVLTGSNSVVVQNKKGDVFNAKIIFVDYEKDLAVLKIDDDDFKPAKQLPYSISKNNTELGEELYTLGYPRDSITYSTGYLSAESGHNGDTSSYQISLSANPGNSGGPVFNKSGEIVGILSARQIQAEGVVFAIKSKNIFEVVDSLKKSDSDFIKIKLPLISGVKGNDRVAQIKNVEDYIFLVKAYNEK